MVSNGFGSVDRGRIVLVVVSYIFDPKVADADALVERFHGWADAVARAGMGAVAVAVVQRYARDLVLRRGMVDYRFVADDKPAVPPAWFAGGRVVEAVRALGPTVVHVDALVFPALVRRLRMTLPRRTSILAQDHGGIHAQSPLFRSWPRRALFSAGLRGADGLLFTASEQAGPWRRAGIIGRFQAIHEVLEGSTDLAGQPFTVAERPLPGRPSLLWVGRLDANKDPLGVLRGFELAGPALPNSVLTMVFGDDQLLPQVRSRIAESPTLRARVRLLGRVERSALPALYSGADLFVLGSHHEGSGYALLEALSFGVTPVVTDIPSFRRITGEGRLGALFPPGDAAKLAVALGAMGALDLASRRAVVRAHFERHLSWSAVGRRAVEIYGAAALARQNRVNGRR